MLIWIPVNGEDEKLSKVTPLLTLKKWALVDFDEGEVKSVQFFDRREDFNEWVDFVEF